MPNLARSGLNVMHLRFRGSGLGSLGEASVQGQGLLGRCGFEVMHLGHIR